MKNKHAQGLAKLRTKSLSPERRKEIASNAAKAGWAKGAYTNRPKRGKKVIHTPM